MQKDPEWKDMGVKERERERAQKPARAPRGSLEVPDRRRKGGKHDRNPQEKWEEPVQEHRIDEQRQNEKTEALVATKCPQERAERKHGAGQIRRNHEYTGRGYADDDGQRRADEIVDDVLSTPERKSEVVVEPKRGIVETSHDPYRCQVER